jgi:hypothetical protein
MSFPKAHHKQIHSTNPLERLNAEIKRRTDVVGIFRTKPRSRGASVRCCSSRATIRPLGCPPWSTEYESNQTKTHDSYITPRDVIAASFP